MLFWYVVSFVGASTIWWTRKLAIATYSLTDSSVSNRDRQSGPRHSLLVFSHTRTAIHRHGSESRNVCLDVHVTQANATSIARDHILNIC
jgi:hypothetical protein